MAAFVDLKERMNMTFLTLDYCGKEVIYGGKNLATGTVACDVLNIPEETVQQRVGGFSAWLHTVACCHLQRFGGIRRYFHSPSIYPIALTSM